VLVLYGTGTNETSRLALGNEPTPLKSPLVQGGQRFFLRLAKPKDSLNSRLAGLLTAL